MITEKLSHLKHAHRVQPYKHQQVEFEKSRNLKHYALFWEMGTGKSKPIVDTIAHLFLAGEIDGSLIISDKGAYLNWEYEELPKHMPDIIPWRVAHWSSYLTSDERRKLESVMVAQDDMLDIMVMNVEALSSEKSAQVAERFLKNHYTIMVVDESTSIKNLKAERTKNTIRLGGFADYRRILTGTPITQSPLDLFSQCQFLQPGVLGFTSFTAFRSFYADVMLQRFGNRQPFYQVTGYKNLDVLTKSLTKFSSRILKTECLDLPAKVYELQIVEHTPEQRGAYQSLKHTAIVAHEQGLLTVTNALTMISKLQQINCGHLKLDDGTVIDIANNRIPTLVSLLDTLGDQKVIIWCAFQKDVENIVKALTEEFPDRTAVTYYGGTPDVQRQENLLLWRKDPKVPWLVGTAATGGKGLTLVEANYTVYFSNTYNLEDRLQSEDRNHRIGQTRSVTYIDFMTPKTVDVGIIQALKEKKDLASEVLDKFRDLVS